MGFNNFAYLLICEKSKVCAVLDPTEAYPVWSAAEDAGVKLQAILCTHHHYDHTGGIEDFLDEQPDLRVYGFAGDARRISGLNRPLADGYFIP